MHWIRPGENRYIDEYDAVRARLEAPARRVIADWPDFAHPFEAPAEPDWPAPRALRSEELAHLRDRLGWDAWRVCLWSAAEMALPLLGSHAWREAEAPPPNGSRDSPASTQRGSGAAHVAQGEAAPINGEWVAAAYRLVRVAHGVLWDGLHPLELFEAASSFFLIEREELPQPGRYAWYAIRNALHGWTGGVRHYVQAHLAAQQRDPGEREAPAQIFAAWWQRCRCRLAFTRAPEAQITEETAGNSVQTVVTRAIASSHPRRTEASSLVLHWLNRAGDGRGTAASPEGPVSPPDEEGP